MQAPTETLREQLHRVNGELYAAGRYDNFLRSLEDSWNRYGSLTERQEAALVRSLAQRAERQAQREVAPTSPMPEGRVEVTGTVLSTKYQESQFGGCYKMLVQSDAGWKVWGTIPTSLGYNCKGLRVTFTATVESKEAAFGFFSRPSKASVIEAPVAPAAPAIVARPADIACTNKPTFVSRPARGPGASGAGTDYFHGHAPVAPAKLAEAAQTVVATANKLSEIIARAKALEAAKEERQERGSGYLPARDWDTDSMAA